MTHVYKAKQKNSVPISAKPVIPWSMAVRITA